MTDAQIAWVAGIFEGEGCIINHPSRGNGKQRRLVVRMTDEDIIRRLQKFTGCGQVYIEPRPRPEWKTIYNWTVCRWPDVQMLLEAMLPWFGDRRQVAALALLANPAGSVGGQFTDQCKRGHPRTPENTYRRPDGGRACRVCARMHSRKWYHERGGKEYFERRYAEQRELRAS